MSTAPSEILHLLALLEPFADTAIIVLKPGPEGSWSLEAERRFIRRGGDADALAALIRVIGDAVFLDSGPDAADTAEKELWKKAGEKGELAAAACRKTLITSLPDSICLPLQKFTEKMPKDSMQSLGFAELPLETRLAVMHGVEGAVVMMREVTALLEGDDSPYRPGVTSLALSDVERAQKVLAKAIKKWGEALLAPLSALGARRDMPFILAAVRRLIQFTRPKLLLAFIDALTATTVADIFTVQKHVTGELERFAAATPLPRGLDALSYAGLLKNLHELLFDAVCRHISYLKGITVKRLVEGEARMLLQSDIRLTLGNLLRLFFNNLLQDLPAGRELKMRASVKGFDHEGLHADFVRDCIARRDSFSIYGLGALRNAVDRERDVAGSKRDMEFFEQRMEEYAKAVIARRGRELQNAPDDPEAEELPLVEVPDWERPDVRHSPAMTPDDLKEGRETVMLGIPEIPLRMAVTALANQSALKVIEAFYRKDPGPGVAPRGQYKHMTMTFTPGANELAVSALLFHDTLNAAEREYDPVSVNEVPLGDISFTQIEYTVHLRPRRTPAGTAAPGWRAGKVHVDSVFTYLLPCGQRDPGGRNRAKSS